MDEREPDAFAPKTDSCLKLPRTVSVHFIGSEADVSKLDSLVGMPMIGIDTEWKSYLGYFVEKRIETL